MEVHVVHEHNKNHYAKELNQFFRQRHDIYVEEKKWREPDPEGIEKDQFDTEDATYFLGIRDGNVIAGTRLIPCDMPHLLSEVFPQACNLGGVVRRADYAEWTRGYIVKSQRDRFAIKLKAASCAAIMEYCWRSGVHRLGGIQEMYWLPLWRKLGWNVEYCGTPLEIEGIWCVAAFFEVNEAAVMSAREKAGLTRSNLVHRGPLRPFHPHSVTLPMQVAV
jgi:acyl-homoserine lactone synthase